MGLCNLERVVQADNPSLAARKAVFFTELFGQVVCLCFLYVAVWTSCLSLFSLRVTWLFGQSVCPYVVFSLRSLDRLSVFKLFSSRGCLDKVSVFVFFPSLFG